MRDIAYPSETEIVVTTDALAERVRELAHQINIDYADRDVVLVGVLKGALRFLWDIARAIEVRDVEFDFIGAKSYHGSATESSGHVEIYTPIDIELQGRHVLVIDDIIDSGRTMQRVLSELATHDPASLEVCVLLMKEESQQVSLERPRYVGFPVPPKVFVVGYGLDYDGHYRNLPFVTVLMDE